MDHQEEAFRYVQQFEEWLSGLSAIVFDLRFPNEMIASGVRRAWMVGPYALGFAPGPVYNPFIVADIHTVAVTPDEVVQRLAAFRDRTREPQQSVH